jgi:hypothetical protein
MHHVQSADIVLWQDGSILLLSDLNWSILLLPGTLLIVIESNKLEHMQRQVASTECQATSLHLMPSVVLNVAALSSEQLAFRFLAITYLTWSLSVAPSATGLQPDVFLLEMQFINVQMFLITQVWVLNVLADLFFFCCLPCVVCYCCLCLMTLIGLGFSIELLLLLLLFVLLRTQTRSELSWTRQ